MSKNAKKLSKKINLEKKIENVREALRENYVQQKKLMDELSRLLSLYKKEIKLSTSTNCDFNKPQPVPTSLKKLLKIKENFLPRSKITNLMHQYFTKNKMYNSKKQIIPNQKIKEIFGMTDGDIIDFYNLQTWLKKLYTTN